MLKQKKKRKKKKNKGSRVNFFKKVQGASPSAWAFGTWGRTFFKKGHGASVSACAWALGEEGFLKNEFLLRVLHSGKRFKKRNFFPECCTRGRVKKSGRRR
jgi:hypothetical protein